MSIGKFAQPSHVILNTNQQTLYIIFYCRILIVQLNNQPLKSRNKYLSDEPVQFDEFADFLIVNNSLYAIGGEKSDSISKWTGKITFTKVGSIYKKKKLHYL